MHQSSLPGRFGSILSLSLGYLSLHIFGVAALGALVAPFFSTNPEQQPFHVVVSGGNALKYSPWRLTPDYIYQTLDGQPVDIPDLQRISRGVYLQPKESVQSNVFAARPRAWSTVMFSVGPSAEEAWYLVQKNVPAGPTVYFVAYSNRTRTPVRYLGIHGHSAIEPGLGDRFQLVRGADGIFTDSGRPITYQAKDSVLDTSSALGTFVSEYVMLVTKRGIEHVYLKQGLVKLILETPDLFSYSGISEIRSASGMSSEAFPQEFQTGSAAEETRPNSEASVADSIFTNAAIALRSDDSIYRELRGKIDGKYRIPEELRKLVFTAYPINSQLIYYAIPDDSRGTHPWEPREVIQANASGEILKRQTVVQPTVDRTFTRLLESFSVPLLIPIPLFHVAYFTALLGPAISGQGMETIAFWAICICTAIASVYLTKRFSRLYSNRNVTWGWLVYVALSGIPGLVGYLIHFRHRISPQCSPEPRTGTEIFA